MTGATAEAAVHYQGTYQGQADQVQRVRAAIAWHLEGCPVADDTVLIASELAGNAVLHSASAGQSFTVRCEIYASYIWLEVEDLGGDWHLRRPGERPHGLDIVEPLAGPDNWGVEMAGDGARIVWARLEFTAGLAARA